MGVGHAPFVSSFLVQRALYQIIRRDFAQIRARRGLRHKSRRKCTWFNFKAAKETSVGTASVPFRPVWNGIDPQAGARRSVQDRAAQVLLCLEPCREMHTRSYSDRLFLFAEKTMGEKIT